MASVQQVLKVASSEIGYSRWTDPQPGSKYGRWYAKLTNDSYMGQSGVPFCAMFVSWVLHQCGVNFTYAYCPYILRDFASKQVNVRNAQPGDLVLFDWNRDGVCDHVGFVEANKGSYLQTIEGNTSNSSNANGGTVARRTRNFSYIKAVIRLNLSGSAAPSTPSQGGSGKLAEDGVWGYSTTLRLQQVLGAPYKDGQISRQNQAWKSRCPGCTSGWQWIPGGGEGGSQTIALVQKKVGVTADGLIGPDTINALIRYYKASSGATVEDGRIDSPSITVQAMQRALNAGRF